MGRRSPGARAATAAWGLTLASACAAREPRQGPDPVVSARPIAVLLEAIQSAAILEGCELRPERIRPSDPVIQIAAVGIACEASDCWLGTSTRFETQIVVRAYDLEAPGRQWFVVTYPLDLPGDACIDRKVGWILDRVRAEVAVLAAK